jgi:DNA-binding HxlR family transcriptional regulator
MCQNGGMALPRDYSNQECSLARTLEIVGERWTLLIVRDAFYGVRRFSDFLAHLKIPKAVLSERLNVLVGADVLERVPGRFGHDEYEIIDKGLRLWPTIRCLTGWGDEHYAPAGPRRLFMHATCGCEVDERGVCPSCETLVGVGDLIVVPGPGLPPIDADADPVTAALARPHRMLEPLDTRLARRRPDDPTS